MGCCCCCCCVVVVVVVVVVGGGGGGGSFVVVVVVLLVLVFVVNWTMPEKLAISWWWWAVHILPQILASHAIAQFKMILLLPLGENCDETGEKRLSYVGSRKHLSLPILLQIAGSKVYVERFWTWNGDIARICKHHVDVLYLVAQVLY